MIPVRDDVLEADKYPPGHVQLVDSGVDGIFTGPVVMEPLSVGDHKEDPCAYLEHLPVSGTKRLS